MYLNSLTDLRNNNEMSLDDKKKIFLNIFPIFERRVREVI